MESIRHSIRRLTAVALCATAVPAARAQDAAPRALPAAAAYQHVPLIPRDVGSFAAQNQLPPPITPRKAFTPPPMPTVTPAAPSSFRQSAWLSAPTTAHSPAPAGEPGLGPKREPASAPQTQTQTQTPYQTFPAMTAPSAAPAWRWHGYGAVAVTEVAQPYSPGAQPPAFTPSQPVKPADAKPAEAKADDQPILPVPATANVQNAVDAEWVPPTGTTPAPLPALPSTPPSTTPLTYLDPVWKSPDDQLAGTPTDAHPSPDAPRPAGPSVVPAGYTTPASTPQPFNPQPQLPTPGSFGSAFYPANPVVTAGPPRNYTSRGVSESPTTYPATARNAPAAAKLAAFTAPQQQPVARPRTAEPARVPVRRVEPPRPADTLAQFKAIIERVCAGKGHGVELTAKGPGSLLLKLKVRKADDAESLASQIAQIPELGPYQISYEIQVGP